MCIRDRASTHTCVAAVAGVAAGTNATNASAVVSRKLMSRDLTTMSDLRENTGTRLDFTVGGQRLASSRGGNRALVHTFLGGSELA